jgi:flagellar biosynthesis chaperone FliJ
MNIKRINEKDILPLIENILSEEVSKVNRNDYSKVHFKLDELESQISETIKEYRKLEDAIPDGLKTLSNGRVKTIGENLINAQNTLKVLRNKIKQHRKNNYQQNISEKK